MLSALLGPRRTSLARRAQSFDDGWTSLNPPWISGRRGVQSGVVVDEDIALTYAAVWCATRIIAETSAGLPLFLYKRLPDAGREQATKHPVYHLVHTAPNSDMGTSAWREGRVSHQVNWGNGFSEIERDGDGKVVALWP